ncbi:MAG: hypothetical protein LBD28_04690 [Tannerellaceae bacterium]|nr:hypothetical protein [Tannerellaceae bacterium]
MTANLGFLPAWYGSEGDYVLCSSGHPDIPDALRPPITAVDVASLKAGMRLPPLQAAPWGLSPASIRMFKELREKYLAELELPQWNERYAELLGRQTAAICLEEIRCQLPFPVMPTAPTFYSDPEAAARFLEKKPGRFVLKAPYSSSGRGLMWMQGGRCPTPTEMQWINGTISRQGSISIEPALDRALDFALEFYADANGNVNYEGLSVFYANDKGVYKYNRLQAQNLLWRLPEAYLGANLRNVLPEAVAAALSRIYAHHYVGYLGVDMFVYRTPSAWGLHPCVEVNLRYTMGLLALRLFEGWVDEGAQATFFVEFHRDGALDKHLRMQAKYPLQISRGKLSSGYISLCPVDKNTQYVAGLALSSSPCL